MYAIYSLPDWLISLDIVDANLMEQLTRFSN